MNCASANVLETPTEAKGSAIHFPAGIPGFESVKRYLLLADPEDAPFAWLEMAEEPRLAFLVISPGCVTDAYSPDISRQDVESLGLKEAGDALVFNIATLHGDGRATVNLRGPILINRHTLVAKQVVPLNAIAYPLQHPLKLSPT